MKRIRILKDGPYVSQRSEEEILLESVSRDDVKTLLEEAKALLRRSKDVLAEDHAGHGYEQCDGARLLVDIEEWLVSSDAPPSVDCEVCGATFVGRCPHQGRTH